MRYAEDDTLPPVVRLVLDEPRPPFDRGDNHVRKWFRRLEKELRRQAIWTRTEHQYDRKDDRVNPTAFVVVPEGVLDPFSRTICVHPQCRVNAARQLATTIGLYADQIVLSDHLTAGLAGLDTIDDDEAISFATQVLVLQELKPLIREGIIHFQPGVKTICMPCFNEYRKYISEATETVLHDLAPVLTTTIRGDRLCVDIANLYDATMTLRKPLTEDDQRLLSQGSSMEDLGRAAFLEDLQYNLMYTCFSLRNAAATHGTLLSSSRASLIALRQIESLPKPSGNVEVWEAERSVQLPWIRELSVEQVITLRHEAKTALPRLREYAAGALHSGTPQEKQGDAYLHHLRAEAEEVRAEIASLRPRQERLFRNVAGVLGLTISVYGYGSGFIQPGAALGSLLTLLGLLHSSSKADASKEDELKSRPGYVLVRGRELLEQNAAGSHRQKH